MDIDENDILFTNSFITQPELSTEIPQEFNDEFAKYYKKQLENDYNNKLKNINPYPTDLDENTDSNSIYTTNKLNESTLMEPFKRKSKEVKTYVSIDSRDRDKILYPKPSNFKIFLGKTFYNVKTIKLASVEFPNTNAVINSTNNNIYWRNQEDIDDDIIDNITKTYPVYNVELRIGSYITSTLTTEMTNKLASIKRRNKTGDFHYFILDLDIDTDIVTITSLVLTQLPNNPISVTIGLGLITVTAPNHGYSTGDVIYIDGGKNIAGISSSVINGPQIISVLNSNTIQFEVNVKAGETSNGGGNTVKTGRKAPFQLLFGENNYTVAQNIGYPLENSSQRLDTSIKAMNNFYQVKITTTEFHNFQNTFDFIGQTCIINASGTTPTIDGNKIITGIIDSKSFLISVNTKIDFSIFNSGDVTFNSRTMSIISSSNYDIDTVLITTFTPHNYDPLDIGKTITFYDTISKPTFNQENTIYSVLSDTLLIIPGLILDGGDVNVSTPGLGGTMPRHDPFITQTKIINTFTTGNISIIGCTNHNLSVGDRIKFYNIITSPSITNTNSGIYTVYSVLDNNTFTINFMTTSYDIDVLNKELAYIGLADIIVTFPYHNFNKITNITTITDTGGYNVEINTQLPHNLSDLDTVRIMETNTIPSIDDGDYIIRYVDSDTFRIIFPGGITSGGTSGIIGMSNDFYIYGASSVGGIEANSINKLKYTVKNIIDIHTFTFESISFANTSTKGGGDNVFISSLKHGFNGVQTNTKNSLLNRSINLEGENYAFLCCPQLATMRNTGYVENIFARITLDQSPGNMVFNFLSNPKEFDTPINALSDLEFSVVNYDNTLYEFNDLDHSFCLEITEIIDTTESFNYSSRRGINV